MAIDLTRFGKCDSPHVRYPDIEPWSQALWDVDLRYAVDDGAGKIASAPDQRGTLNALAANVAGNKPTLNTALVPGAPCGDWGTVAGNTLNLRGITDGPGDIFDNQAAMTMHMRVRPQQAVGTFMNACFLGRDAANVSRVRLLRDVASGFLSEADRGNSSGVTQIRGGTVALDAWQSWDFTYDGTTLRLYVNTVLAASAASSWSMLNLKTWVLGSNYTNTNSWTGQIGNWLGWSKVLSARELLAQHMRDSSVWS